MLLSVSEIKNLNKNGKSQNAFVGTEMLWLNLKYMAVPLTI